MIYSIDVPNSRPLREPHRAAHLEFLNEHLPKLIASGGIKNHANGDYTGSCILLDVATEAEARAFVQADPFTAAGIARQVIVAEWTEFYRDGKRTYRTFNPSDVR